MRPEAEASGYLVVAGIGEIRGWLSYETGFQPSGFDRM